MKSASARRVSPRWFAALLFLTGAGLHAFAAYLLITHGWAPTITTAAAIVASVLGLGADALFGVAVHAAGWDSMAIRAIARSNIPNTAILRARLRASHLGALAPSELEALLYKANVELDGSRVTYASYSGQLDVEQHDEGAALGFVFESNRHKLKALDEAIEQFQDRIQELKSKLISPNMLIQDPEFSLADVQLEHWNSPIDGVAVVPTGATWSRQLKPRELKRLRQYLLANVELE